MYQSYKTDYSTESDNGIGYFVSLIQNFITEYVRRAGRMKNRKVRNFAEFALWTKTRMLERGISQRELAAGMGTHQARISEAITGKPSGKKFIIPLIQELGGNMDDFKDFLNTVYKSRTRRCRVRQG